MLPPQAQAVIGIIIAVLILISVILILVGSMGLLKVAACTTWTYMFLGGVICFGLAIGMSKILIPGGVIGLGEALKGYDPIAAYKKQLQELKELREQQEYESAELEEPGEPGEQ